MKVLLTLLAAASFTISAKVVAENPEVTQIENPTKAAKTNTNKKKVPKSILSKDIETAEDRENRINRVSSSCSARKEEIRKAADALNALKEPNSQKTYKKLAIEKQELLYVRTLFDGINKLQSLYAKAIVELSNGLDDNNKKTKKGKVYKNLKELEVDLNNFTEAASTLNGIADFLKKDKIDKIVDDISSQKLDNCLDRKSRRKFKKCVKIISKNFKNYLPTESGVSTKEATSRKDQRVNTFYHFIRTLKSYKENMANQSKMKKFKKNIEKLKKFAEDPSNSANELVKDIDTKKTELENLAKSLSSTVENYRKCLVTNPLNCEKKYNTVNEAKNSFNQKINKYLGTKDLKNFYTENFANTLKNDFLKDFKEKFDKLYPITTDDQKKLKEGSEKSKNKTNKETEKFKKGIKKLFNNKVPKQCEGSSNIEMMNCIKEVQKTYPKGIKKKIKEIDKELKTIDEALNDMEDNVDYIGLHQLIIHNVHYYKSNCNGKMFEDCNNSIAGTENALKFTKEISDILNKAQEDKEAKHLEQREMIIDACKSKAVREISKELCVKKAEERYNETITNTRGWTQDPKTGKMVAKEKPKSWTSILVSDPQNYQPIINSLTMGMNHSLWLQYQLPAQQAHFKKQAYWNQYQTSIYKVNDYLGFSPYAYYNQGAFYNNYNSTSYLDYTGSTSLAGFQYYGL